MTTKEAADYLGIKHAAFKHIFYASNKSEPAPTRLRGRVFFTPENLHEFVSKNTKKKRGN